MFHISDQGVGVARYTDTETSHHLMHRGLQVTLSLQEESQVHNRMGACVDILFSYFIMPNYQVPRSPTLFTFLGFTDGSRVVNVVSSKFILNKRSPGKSPLTWWPWGTLVCGKRRSRDCVHFCVVCVCVPVSAGA